jgi:hypothetical protein
LGFPVIGFFRINQMIMRGLMMVCAVFALFAVGCGSNVTKANYDKVKTGMSLAEVEKILGAGEEQASSSVEVPGQNISIPGGGSASFAGMSSSGSIYLWKSGDKMITITFMNDKVAGKAKVNL